MSTTKMTDFKEGDIFNYSKSILNILLKDRTTNKNIIWATDDYIICNSSYHAYCEMNKESFNIIRPRVAKSQEQQNSRIKSKAEVFTPLWICNTQNNLVDERWFGRKNVFNVGKNKSWKSTKEKIIFPENRTWKEYVDARRMEISCGEAPYLVSRYDTITGKVIKIKDRIGLLDRKLRIVNENANTEPEWLKWAERAFQSIYGFELQGDNLLLARKNLLFTFMENLQFKFNRKPTEKELRRIATIISWNIWQMDVNSYASPYYSNGENIEHGVSTSKEVSDKKDNSKESTPKECIIKDWRSRKYIKYKMLVEKK